EIISIPLEGDLQHKDSMGNVAVIKEGDVQVMSAGTGIRHSEFNKNGDKEVKFLQIWLFPRAKNVAPRYDQISIDKVAQPNEFYQILSPNPDDEGVWIHQDAWFHIGDIQQGQSARYQLKKPGNGIYAFIIDGAGVMEGLQLARRDGLGIWDTNEVSFTASADAKVLLMEVPVTL
ncbi:MAG: pirin family protein, partial [Bacteroidota bacterium]